MEFERRGKYFEKSKCNRYTVAAYQDLERWTFAAWRIPATLLGFFDQPSEARARCEQHAKSTEGQALWPAPPSPSFTGVEQLPRTMAEGGAVQAAATNGSN